MGEGVPHGKLLCFSAFSGIGGLDLGLEHAGFSTIAGIENDTVARRSLALNRPNLQCLSPHDINEVASHLHPCDLGIAKGELSLLAAGPPCQPFSNAAQWSRTGARGLGDHRTQTLYSLLTLIERLLPRAILIENVPGFVKGNRSALSILEERLEAVNCWNGTRYRLACRILNAADFGVPQRRKRAILIAFRCGAVPTWPAPTHRDHPVRAWDALHNVCPTKPPAPSGRFAALLPSIPEGQNYQFFTERGEGPPLFGYRRRFWSFLLKLAKIEPAWTVPANPGPATGPFHWDSRPLAPEEILRLQTFPSSWKLDGTHREQVRQAGNATPPLLAEILGRSIAAQLCGDKIGGNPVLAIPRSEFVPPPTPPRPVAAEYMAFAGHHDPHPGAGRGPRPRLRQSGGSPNDGEELDSMHTGVE